MFYATSLVFVFSNDHKDNVNELIQIQTISASQKGIKLLENVNLI